MVSIPQKHWDRHNECIAVPNGFINLRTGKIVNHSPSHLITVRSEVVYDPLAECPQWEAFLAQVQPDPAVRTYLQAIAAYCLLGQASMQEIYIFVGTGGNGKGTFKEVLRHILGGYAVVASKTLFLKHPHGAPHPTDLAALYGKHWATVSEFDESGLLDCTNLKSLTGGDTVTARKIGKDFFDFELKATITVDTNDIPHITECSPAMRRRLVVINWPYRAVVADRELPMRLKEEASGILNWLIEGVRMFYAGALRPENRPVAVQAATAALWSQVDILQQWIDSECKLEAAAETDINVLDLAYIDWCKANRYPEPRRLAVSKKLRLAEFPCRKSNCKTLYKGIRLRTQAEKAVDQYDDLDFAVPLNAEPAVEVESTPKKPPASESAPKKQRRMI